MSQMDQADHEQVNNEANKAQETVLEQDNADAPDEVAENPATKKTKKSKKENKLEAALKAKFEALQHKVEQVQSEVEGYKDAALRAKAELDNVRRRAKLDVESAHKYALDRFVKELLAVADTLQHCLEVKVDDAPIAKSMQDGAQLTMKMLLDTMAKFGVEQINPVGEAFDPELHEAVSMQANPEMEDNLVMAVVQMGYQLNGRLVRAAKVVVVKN